MAINTCFIIRTLPFRNQRQLNLINLHTTTSSSPQQELARSQQKTMASGVNTLGKGSWADQKKLLNPEFFSRSDLSTRLLFLCGIILEIPVKMSILPTKLRSLSGYSSLDPQCLAHSRCLMRLIVLCLILELRLFNALMLYSIQFKNTVF